MPLRVREGEQNLSCVAAYLDVLGAVGIPQCGDSLLVVVIRRGYVGAPARTGWWHSERATQKSVVHPGSGAA